MAELQTEIKVGIFTAFALLVLAVTVMFFSVNPFGKKAHLFHTVLENVGGIGPRTQVRASGVYVGEVTDIDILPKGAQVNFTVDSSVPIPKDSHVEIKARGILGDVYLEIIRNLNTTESLPSGSFIQRLGDTQDLSALMASLGSIVKDVKVVTQSLAATLGNGKGETVIGNILSNIENFTAQASNFMKEQKKSLASFVQHAERAADNAENLTVSLNHMFSPGNQVRFNHILASLDSSLINIKSATTKVASLVDKVERGEGSLGQFIVKNEAADDLRQTLKGVGEVLKPFTKIKMEVDYKAELRNQNTTFINQAANHFNLHIRTNPDKSYILGVSDSPGAQVISSAVITDTCPDNGPQTNCSQRTIVEKRTVPDDRGRLRFNAQFSKRYQWIGLRFGLFESYAGFAGDVYLFSDKLHASVEAFQFHNTGPNPSFAPTDEGFVRLKTYVNYFITPNVYTTVGADNVIRSPTPMAFLGAGLYFNDDDLKNVFGVATLAK